MHVMTRGKRRVGAGVSGAVSPRVTRRRRVSAWGRLTARFERCCGSTRVGHPHDLFSRSETKSYSVSAELQMEQIESHQIVCCVNPGVYLFPVALKNHVSMDVHAKLRNVTGMS